MSHTSGGLLCVALRQPDGVRTVKEKKEKRGFLCVAAALRCSDEALRAVGTSQVLQPRPLKAASRPSKPLILIVGVNADKSCGEGSARFSSWCLFVTAKIADKEKKETAVGNETLRFSTNCGALTHHCVLYSEVNWTSLCARRLSLVRVHLQNNSGCLVVSSFSKESKKSVSK